MSSIFQGLVVDGEVNAFNVMDPDVPTALNYFRALGFGGFASLVISDVDTGFPTYIGGLKCSPFGVVIVNNVVEEFDHWGVGGLPQDIDNKLIVSTDSTPATYFHQGVPYVGNAIVFEGGSIPPPVLMGAFSDGFSDGFDIGTV